MFRLMRFWTQQQLQSSQPAVKQPQISKTTPVAKDGCILEPYNSLRQGLRPD